VIVNGKLVVGLGMWLVIFSVHAVNDPPANRLGELTYECSHHPEAL
jgi:hypothetical protein